MKKANEGTTQDSSSPILGVLEKTLLEAKEHMKLITKQQATMANDHVMIQAPVKESDNYFKEVYESNTLDARIH